MIHITFEALEDEARKLVNEVSYDFVYTPENGARGKGMACSNWHMIDGERVPGCIVGTLLHRLGVPLSAMDKGGSFGVFLRRLVANGIISEPDGRVSKFLRVAQVAQDSGATWYSAVAVAIHVVNDQP